MQITTEQIASSIETLVPDNGSRKAILEILLEAIEEVQACGNEKWLMRR